MRTSILYDAGADHWAAADVRAVRESVDAVADVLDRADHAVAVVPVRRDRVWMGALARSDLVFNLCEGVEGVSRLEYQVAAVVELWGLPMTGTSARTIALCHRKSTLNALLSRHGLPVPDWCEVSAPSNPCAVSMPAIVKPAEEDASIGIDQRSVVTTRAELRDRVEEMRARFGRVIAQRYVAGREFNVGFVGDEALPVSEIDFTNMPSDAWPIVSFAAKWEPDSAEDLGTQPVCPAQVDPDLADRILHVARSAWMAVDGHGYGRVDLRLDDRGTPWILEVNPCPDASPNAGLANMARAHGWSYDDLVLRIVDAALAAHAATTTPAGVH